MQEMISPSLSGTAPVADFADLQERLVEYASRIGELRTPNDVLEALHAITTKSLPLGVLGAVQFPVNATGWSTAQLGKSVFLHKEVPGWVVGRAYRALAGKIHSALVPGQVEPCFIYVD